MDSKIYRFGEFELSTVDGMLRGPDGRVQIQDKPLRLLCALLDRPRQVVTREELRDCLWDDRTVVNFDQGINVALRKVRLALGDSSEQPRFIETLARKGYRFLPPVEVLEPEVLPSASPVPPAAPDPTLTPAGPPPALAQESATRRPRRRLVPWLVAAIGCVAAGLGFVGVALHEHAAVRSLAVLPLADLSGQADNGYLAAGITDELTTRLGESLRLRVVSNSSARRFDKTPADAGRIARELGVDALVEGAVAREAGRLTVSVRLIDARTDRQLWAHSFDRPIEDVLAVEMEISQSVARAVSTTLDGQPAPAAHVAAIDPQAHDEFLLARYHLGKRTATDLAMARDGFLKVVARAPDYAPAYAGLASAYALMPSYGSVPLDTAIAEATEAARRALAIDDNTAEAHATLAFLALHSPLDLRYSEAEFRRALAIDPNATEIHHWFSYQRFFTGHAEEALAEIRTARELDPLSAVTNADEGHFLYATHRLDEARARLARAIELAPDFGQPHATLALVALEEGNAVEAFREARAAITLDPTGACNIGEVGYVFAHTGHARDAEGLLAGLVQRGAAGENTQTYIALIEAGLGRDDQALQTLEQASRANHGSNLVALPQWHAFDVLRNSPRLQALRAEVL